MYIFTLFYEQKISGRYVKYTHFYVHTRKTPDFFGDGTLLFNLSRSFFFPPRSFRELAARRKIPEFDIFGRHKFLFSPTCMGPN